LRLIHAGQHKRLSGMQNFSCIFAVIHRAPVIFRKSPRGKTYQAGAAKRLDAFARDEIRETEPHETPSHNLWNQTTHFPNQHQ
jgi:hypothetical protein